LVGSWRSGGGSWLSTGTGRGRIAADRESDYGEPIVALKSYVLSPFSEAAHVPAVLESIWQAHRAIAAEPPGD
jgi:hypothetical protein